MYSLSNLHLSYRRLQLYSHFELHYSASGVLHGMGYRGFIKLLPILPIPKYSVQWHDQTKTGHHV